MLELPPLYRNSLFLMLDSLSDNQNINSGPDKLALEYKESHGTVNESEIEEPFEIINVLEELPKKTKVSRSIGPICRELLNDAQMNDESESVTHSQRKARGN